MYLLAASMSTVAILMRASAVGGIQVACADAGGIRLGDGVPGDEHYFSTLLSMNKVVRSVPPRAL